MTMRLALGFLVASGLFLFWRLFQSDLGAAVPAGRDVSVLAITSIAFLAIATALSLLPRRPRRAAILVVRNGVIQRGHDSLTAATQGRAVSVVVQEGHVAVLEKLGRYVRSLGPGAGRLNPGESIHKVILTSPQALVGSVECSTRDAVPVTAEFELDARILAARSGDTARRSSRIAAAQATAGRAPTRGFAWSEEAVVKAAYNAPSWVLETLNAAKHSLRDQLATTSLEEVFDFSESHREALPFSVIADRVRIELGERCREWGAEVLRFQLIQVKLPVSTEQTILANWRKRHPSPCASGLGANEAAGSAEGASPDRRDEMRGAVLRLVPVLSRGPATSLREAVRQRLGYLTADGVEIGGQRYLIRPVVGCPGVELTLRPDATYFALAVQGNNLLQHGVSEGDYMLFESGGSPLSGGLTATLIAGELAVKRLTRKLGHSLLESDCVGRPSVVLTEIDAKRDELFAEYANCLPPVDYWPADDARILGNAVMTFRPISPVPHPLGSQQAPVEGECCAQDLVCAQSPAVPTGGGPDEFDVEGAQALIPGDFGGRQPLAPDSESGKGSNAGSEGGSHE